VSAAEEEMALHLKAHKIAYEREYRFHPERRWRFDFAIPEHKVAIEVEGGAFVNGRHTRGAAFVKDCDKYNAAMLLGWRVFRFVPKQHVQTGLAIECIVRALSEEATGHDEILRDKD
jgi:very-short-patch-repair endonuclease